MRLFVAFLMVLLAGGALAQNAPVPFAAFDKASKNDLADPHDLAFGPDGNLYIADKFGHRVVVMDPDTLEITDILGAGLFPNIHDVSFGPNGEAAISVTGLSRVLVYRNINGDLTKPDQTLQAINTEGALWHSNGRIYAMASGTGQLIAYENGSPIAGADGMFGAHDVAEAPNGNVWVADNRARQLVEFSPDLKRLRVLDDPKYGFAGPRYLDIDGLGRLVVADQDAHRILLIDPDAEQGGSLLGVLGSGTPGEGPNLFDDPEGVAVRGNNFYFSDSDNNRIVKYTVVVN